MGSALKFLARALHEGLWKDEDERPAHTILLVLVEAQRYRDVPEMTLHENNI